MKLLLELGPLLLFFVVNARTHDVRISTATFLVALLVALPLAWRLEKKLPLVPVITAAFVLVFGGLTIALGDETFIQLKPTVASLFFAVAIGVGLARGKLLLKTILGSALALDGEGWRILSVRWIGYFVALAAVNEVVRLVLTWDQWVTFKTFGILPLTILFTVSQLGVMQRHELPDEPEETEDSPELEASPEPVD